MRIEAVAVHRLAPRPAVQEAIHGRLRSTTESIRGDVLDVLLSPTVQHQARENGLEVPVLRFAETFSYTSSMLARGNDDMLKTMLAPE